MFTQLKSFIKLEDIHDPHLVHHHYHRANLYFEGCYAAVVNYYPYFHFIIDSTASLGIEHEHNFTESRASELGVVREPEAYQDCVSFCENPPGLLLCCGESSGQHVSNSLGGGQLVWCM